MYLLLEEVPFLPSSVLLSVITVIVDRCDLDSCSHTFKNLI